jgi:acetate kinase
MGDYALVLNAGSSSVKFSVYHRQDEDGWRLDSRGQIDGIGTSPRLTAKDGAGHPLADHALNGVRDSQATVEALEGWLRGRYGAARVLGVGHRVVHGGAKYDRPCVVTPQVIEELKALVPLAPLHQPYNIRAVEAVAERLPGVPQVACFDTSFHRGAPAVAELVPLPSSIRERGVQRYGFHGLSYEYIARVLPVVAPAIAQGRVIVAHLGNGASLCAMKGRSSVDYSFGFSVLDGLCMGTRPGSVDPGVILYLFQTLGLSAAEVETILYRKSGLLGVSGISHDMRELLDSTDARARLAVDYFVYQAMKHIGSMAAALGGVDALVFTAGIGEHSAVIRGRICEACAWLGVTLDAAANERHAQRISQTGSRVSAWVIPTNEELMIALHAGRLLGIDGRRHAARQTGA